MTIERASGVLLHPTSFPGPYGIGELGASAYTFIDWLARAGQRYWQVMPLGPTGYGDSPYQSFSAFAGNPYLISLDELRREGLLTDTDFVGQPDFQPDRVDFGQQYVWRNQMLDRAFAHFEAGQGGGHLSGEVEAFEAAEAEWLSDYALFTALKAEQGGLAWNAWPLPLRNREAQVLNEARARLVRDCRRVAFIQFLFFRQWRAVQDYAHSRRIRVIGDIPIFVAMDSADAWAHPEQFYFDAEGQPTVVAGVPPDYFSETGQLWGNPLYRWDVMEEEHFAWWVARMRGVMRLYDVVRIDHFRGFAAYWAVPWPAENAVVGEWVPAPGRALFEVLQETTSGFDIIAEDLGLITPDVEALRDNFGLPGMAVLQFAFTGGDFSVNDFLPGNIKKNRVVYTGTHDNDTTRGWWQKAEPEERRNYRAYTHSDPREDEFAWALTEVAWHTRARLAVVPLQDLLNLDSEARMNLPGSLSDRNWTWRFRSELLTDALAERLRALTQETQRL